MLLHIPGLTLWDAGIHIWHASPSLLSGSKLSEPGSALKSAQGTFTIYPLSPELCQQLETMWNMLCIYIIETRVKASAVVLSGPSWLDDSFEYIRRLWELGFLLKLYRFVTAWLFGLWYFICFLFGKKGLRIIFYPSNYNQCLSSHLQNCALSQYLTLSILDSTGYCLFLKILFWYYFRQFIWNMHFKILSVDIHLQFTWFNVYSTVTMAGLMFQVDKHKRAMCMPALKSEGKIIYL